MQEFRCNYQRTSMMTSSTTVTDSKLRLNICLINKNVEGFEVRNYHGRFLIPSCDNVFGGVQIECVLIDSGSNLSLFPLPMTPDKNFDINHLMRNFPYDQYMWTIRTAYDVGLLTDTTLHIKPIEQNDSPSATF
ncbi:unnamed protein product [Didymodactylos carnosus]|uniref:Uncharacterized protein n=1 Tax=Didymodactylos carnosus TaxID=1234261 RepID=A0A8S2FGG8_9BILA|nr:unnamed protein product [Didymodactylos carnosus]CAF4250119.1 unnamed protein product [Didymodactylos carnosus]